MTPAGRVDLRGPGWVVAPGLWLAAVLSVAGCGGSRRAAGPIVSQTSAPATTTTTAAPTTTTAPVVGTEPRPSPQAAAQRLVETWVAGDRAAGARVSTSTAPVDAIFSRPFVPPAPQNRGCGNGAPAGGNEIFDCVYEYGNGLLRISVAGHAHPGFLVTTARFET